MELSRHAPHSRALLLDGLQTAEVASGVGMGRLWRTFRGWPRWAHVLVVVLAALVVGGTIASIQKTASQSPSISAEKHARDYVIKHGGDAYRVSAMVAKVQLAIQKLGQNGPTQARVNELAQVAQTAYDGIDKIREHFTYSDDGPLGDDEGTVLLGARDLKNAMSAIIAFTATPNGFTLARFRSEYRAATSEWDQGVTAVWRIAHRSKLPTVSGRAATGLG
jgi:hypothetical protein